MFLSHLRTEESVAGVAIGAGVEQSQCLVELVIRPQVFAKPGSDGEIAGRNTKCVAHPCDGFTDVASLECACGGFAKIVDGRWGHDTDSYPQLAGAFIGALHGEEIFPTDARIAVEKQLLTDYGENLDEWQKVLDQASTRSRKKIK